MRSWKEIYIGNRRRKILRIQTWEENILEIENEKDNTL